MAIYGLVDTNSLICQLEAATFPVAAPLAWTTDLSALSPQPAVGWPATATGGVWTYAAPAVPTLTLAQQAAAVLVAGIAVASAGTPAVNRTYAMDPVSRTNIGEAVDGINAGDGFPGDGSTFMLVDPLGSVTFPNTTIFMAVARALRDTYYALTLIAASAPGAPTSLPTQPTPIS